MKLNFESNLREEIGYIFGRRNRTGPGYIFGRRNRTGPDFLVAQARLD
jgi:hypothetical protein